MKKAIKKLFQPGKNNNKKLNDSLAKSLDANLALFQGDIFPEDDTVVYRRFKTSGPHKVECAIVYVEEMVDSKLLVKSVVSPLIGTTFGRDQLGNAVDFISDHVITNDDISVTNKVSKMVSGILQGDTLLLIDGSPKAILIGARKWAVRNITEPVSENVVRGPRDGFTESLAVNLSLVRRRLNTEKLRFERRELGKYTKTAIVVSYIEGIASKEIIEELYRRLDNISIDGVLESGYIEEMIKDSPLSPLKTVGHTERPDVAAAKMLEGRVCVFVDGTPFVLTLPYVFQEIFQANEDYYKNFFLSTIDRMIRYFAFFLTTSTPAIYLSLTTYHQELIPTPLLLSIAAAREGIPFPAVFEVLVMTLVFEVLREGGIRLPNPIGQALSIVGAIVLGDAAVNAQLVSAPMIIIIALTGIASFAVPKILGTALVIRVIFIALASILGLYGYIFGVIGLFIQLASMRSFGVPYMSNLASFKAQDFKDTMIRAPWWVMYYRPKLFGNRNAIRQRKEAKR